MNKSAKSVARKMLRAGYSRQQVMESMVHVYAMTVIDASLMISYLVSPL